MFSLLITGMSAVESSRFAELARRGVRNGGAARARAPLASNQCQGEVAACCGGWILITWCLARSLGAAFGLASMRFVGIRCEGPAGVTL